MANALPSAEGSCWQAVNPNVRQSRCQAFNVFSQSASEMLLAKGAVWQGGRRFEGAIVGSGAFNAPYRGQEPQPASDAPGTLGSLAMQEGQGRREHTQGFSLSQLRAAPLSYGHGNGSCAVNQKSEFSELEMLQMQGRRNTRVLAGLLLIALLSCVLINQ